MAGNATTPIDDPQLEDVNNVALDPTTRLVGLSLMGLCMSLTVLLAIWVYRNRNSPPVRAMQPLFLIVLLLGNIVTNATIWPLSLDDTNTNQHIDQACMLYSYLDSFGSTIILSALFSKLWRVNQIFHAEGFQRKVVTPQEVLWPFGILVSINLVTLITTNVADPLVWVREVTRVDENGDPTETVGYCAYEQGNRGVGQAMEYLQDTVDFVALVILCVQAYRARDIRTEFSEARGVALALFSMAQAVVIVFATKMVLDEENVDGNYILDVLLEITTSMAILFFIFAPLITHQSQFQGGGNRRSMATTFVTGVSLETSNATAASKDGADLKSFQLKEARNRISELEMQVKTLTSRLAEVEQPPPECCPPTKPGDL